MPARRTVAASGPPLPLAIRGGTIVTMDPLRAVLVGDTTLVSGRSGRISATDGSAANCAAWADVSVAATALIVLNLGSSWGIIISLSHHVQPHHSVLGNLVSLATWVVRLIARFTLRDTLEQHFNGPEPLGLRLNPVMTFFFGGIYFQYKLNEINEINETLPYRNPAR